MRQRQAALRLSDELGRSKTERKREQWSLKGVNSPISKIEPDTVIICAME